MLHIYGFLLELVSWPQRNSCRMQDMWTLSGIFRDVYILGQPSGIHISDYHVQTPLEFGDSGSLKSAQLDVVVHLSAAVRCFCHVLA